MLGDPIEVLLLEDDVGDARMFQLVLERAAPGKFQVTVVPRLTEALAALSARAFQIVVTDLNVPDNQGIDTFRKIAAQAGAIPVLVWSGQSDEELAIAAVREGAQDYLIKVEVQGSQLVRALRYALERSKGQAAQVVASQAKAGKAIAFVGVKGGVGTTTVAANVAASLACHEHRVCLVELRPSFGTLTAQLCSTPPATNLRHVLDRGATTIGERDLISPLSHLVPKLRVLFGPQAPSEFATIEAEPAVALLQQLAGLTEFTLFDLPTEPSAASTAVLQHCDYVGIVVERDTACFAAAKICLEALRIWDVSEQRIGAVLVNRGGSSFPMELRHVQAQLGCPILGAVPYATDALALAQQAYTPLVISQKEHMAAQMLTEITERLQREPVGAIKM